MAGLNRALQTTYVITFFQGLLVEIRRRRATFDTIENRRQFGPVVVLYAKVQAKVNLKYDSWHKEVLSRFGQLIGQVCIYH